MLVVLACVGAAFTFPGAALAANAIRTPAHYDDGPVIPAGDDTYTSVVNLPFTMNWNGTVYNRIYVNMNGNCTFGNFSTAYDPTSSMATTNRDMLAPFWADVDTRGTNTELMTNSSVTAGSIPQVDGHDAFIVNWINVGRYNQSGPQNSFQLILIDRSDTGAGNFDIEYNYDTITWDRGTASSNYYARAGWSRTGNAGYELTGGNTSGSYLDTGAHALVDGTLNCGGVLGRYVWSVRNGIPPNSPPLINLTFDTLNLDGTGPAGYMGYSGATDAAATDPDGSIASFVRSPAVGTTLPYGTNTITWTATDNGGRVATATQTITVVDTTPPTLPTLSSPSHTLSTWSTVSNVLLNWTGSLDAGSGVDGYSFNWTANAAGLPDTTKDAFTAGVPSNVTEENQTFPTAAWPADWAIGGTNPTFLTLTNVVARAHGTYAAQLHPTTNLTRIAQFTKTYDLSSYSSATLTFWDYSNMTGAPDYSRVDYSTDGGATWTVLQNLTTAYAWQQRTLPLPTGAGYSSVMLRFSGNLNRSTEYDCWDDINITAVVPGINSTTSAPGDGRWYFNLRAVDAVGNWTPTAASLGPIWIDTVKPTTTSSAPAGWATTSPLVVTLNRTDSTSGVAYTRYKLDAAAVATYTAPLSISTEGTHTLSYWSVDVAGNVETTHNDTVRLDSAAPAPVPGIISASAVSTTNIEVTWSGSTDAVSGLAYYGIWRNGSRVATSAVPSFTDSSLTPGQTYSYQISAYDVAGNQSAKSGAVVEKVPMAQIWLSITVSDVTMPTVDPMAGSSVSTATVVTVGGIGNLNYDFTCSGADFINTNGASTTPTMPVGTLSFATRGWRVRPIQPFSNSTAVVDSGVGTKYVWYHPYTFDYSLAVPWLFEPGTYNTAITYTAVVN